MNLSSINFVLNKRSFAASIRKKLFVSVWAQDNDKNDILRWRIRLSHNGFHEEWIPICVELKRYPLQNQEGSNKSIFSMDDQFFFPEYLP